MIRTGLVLGLLTVPLFARGAGAQTGSDLPALPNLPIPPLQGGTSVEDPTRWPSKLNPETLIRIGVNCVPTQVSDVTTNGGINEKCFGDHGTEDATRIEAKAADRFIRAGFLLAAQVWVMVQQVKGIVTTTHQIVDSYERVLHAFESQGAKTALLRVADAADEVSATLDGVQYTSLALPDAPADRRYQAMNQAIISLLARSRDVYGNATEMSDASSEMAMRIRNHRGSAYGGDILSVSFRKDRSYGLANVAPLANPDNPLDPVNVAPYLPYDYDPAADDSEDWPDSDKPVAAPALGASNAPRSAPAANYAMLATSGTPLLRTSDIARLAPSNQAAILVAGATMTPSAMRAAALIATGHSAPLAAPALRTPAAVLASTRSALSVRAPGLASAPSFQDRYLSNTNACHVAEDDASPEATVTDMTRAASQANAAGAAADMTAADLRASRDRLKVLAATERDAELSRHFKVTQFLMQRWR